MNGKQKKPWKPMTYADMEEALDELDRINEQTIRFAKTAIFINVLLILFLILCVVLKFGFGIQIS